MLLGDDRRLAPGRQAFTGAALALAAFIGIGLGARQGWFESADAAGLLALRGDAERAPAWLAETARDLTALGSNGVLVLLVLVAAGLLAAWRRRREAALLTGTLAGGLLAVGLAKTLVARPRPGLVEPGARVFTTSFPSSHATLAAALCTVAALLLARGAPHPAAAWIAAALVAGLIGLSRLYLGVHWPSDVLAGWALGLAVAALGWATARP